MKLLWQQIANTTATEILCDTAMDGIVLDAEHGYWNNETLVDCIRIIRLYKKMPFVRMKFNEQLVQLCYDNECHSMYSNVEEDFSNIPGLALCKNNNWGNRQIKAHLRTISIAQIESRVGIENLDRIRPGFDYYMLGLYDLSANLFNPGSFHTSEIKEWIKKFEKAIPLKNRGIHLVKNIKSDYEKYKNYGMIAFSLDTLALVDRVKELNKYV